MRRTSYRFLKGFGYAFSGIRDTFKTEINFRIHCFTAIGVVLFGLLLSLSTFEWLWIIVAIAMVLAAELINTAFEFLANAVSLEFNPLIKKAKDASAAAVLVLSVLALLIGLFIFIPKLSYFFNL